MKDLSQTGFFVVIVIAIIGTVLINLAVFTYFLEPQCACHEPPSLIAPPNPPIDENWDKGLQ